jgi:integrase/recombinase XerC
MATDLLTTPKRYVQPTRSCDLVIFLDSFILSCEVDGLSPNTTKWYKRMLGYFIAFFPNIDDPEKITPDYIRSFRLFLQKRVHNGEINEVTVGDINRAVKRFFNWLLAENKIKETPFKNIRNPKIPKVVIQPFTNEQIKTILNVFAIRNDFADIRNRAIVLLFIDTGLRLAELMGIQQTDVDWKTGVIKVTGKGNKERLVKMGKVSHKALLDYRLERIKRFGERLPCLWVGEEGNTLKYWSVCSMVRRLKKRAHIEGVRCSPHTFRHTYCVNAFRNGAKDWEVQVSMGHSTMSTTMLYRKTVESEDVLANHDKFSPIDRMNL